MFSLELMKFIFQNKSNLLKENNILYDFQLILKYSLKNTTIKQFIKSNYFIEILV